MALKPIGDEAITVSSTSVGLTAAQLPPTVGAVLMARVQHLSGGALYQRNTGDASTSAANGEFLFEAGDEIEVWGDKALNAVRFIIKSGESDGVLSVQYFGEG